MQLSVISQQTQSDPFFKTQNRVSAKQESNAAESQQGTFVAKTKSVNDSSGYDLTNMTSGDMLDLAKSFYREGNSQDFLSLAVYSARAALEDHPDSNVAKTWTTPRNKNGTFDLLAEIQATPKYSTGSSDLDSENEADRKHLLNTLLSLPSQTATIKQSSIINIEA